MDKYAMLLEEQRELLKYSLDRYNENKFSKSVIEAEVNDIDLKLKNTSKDLERKKYEHNVLSSYKKIMTKLRLKYIFKDFLYKLIIFFAVLLCFNSLYWVAMLVGAIVLGFTVYACYSDYKEAAEEFIKIYENNTIQSVEVDIKKNLSKLALLSKEKKGILERLENSEVIVKDLENNIEKIKSNISKVESARLKSLDKLLVKNPNFELLLNDMFDNNVDYSIDEENDLKLALIKKEF